jgi:hypothetical protein
MINGIVLIENTQRYQKRFKKMTFNRGRGYFYML